METANIFPAEGPSGEMSEIIAGKFEGAEEIRRCTKLQTSQLLSPEQTPQPISTDDVAPASEPIVNYHIYNMEPSLQLDLNAPGLAVQHTDLVPPGDDIEFSPSRGAPEIPGISSVTIRTGDAREMQPPSPRSGRSSHSSYYRPGSVQASTRTSTAGGPATFHASTEQRTLVRSREPKADLNTGDVVMLMHKGRPYVAVQVRLPYKDDAVHTCLELAEEGTECGPLSYLEVIRQDTFVGFRSGAAGNRFLQPRRRAPHRLVFFNERCGVWEQWDVTGDRDWRRTPWSSVTMELRSRRLHQVNLTVEVVRVGCFTSPGGPGGRGLLSIIPEDASLEDRNLRRITNLLVAEWFKFVDHEKLLREGLENDLVALADEAQELKLQTIQQVEYLRVHMNEEVASLSHHVMLRDSIIATLRRWLRRGQQLAADRMAKHRHRRIFTAWRILAGDIVSRKCMILKLRCKHNDAFREAAFWAWKLHTRAVLGAASKLQFAVQRRSHTLMSRVLQGWQRAVTRRAWRGRNLMLAAQRSASRRLRSTLTEWRRLTVQRARGWRALLRALNNINISWLSAAFTTWRAAAQTVCQQVVQADLLLARRTKRLQAAAMAAWVNQVCRRRLTSRVARVALKHKTLKAWRSATVAALSRQAQSQVMAADRQLTLRCEMLKAWHCRAVKAGTLRYRLGQYVTQRSAALQGQALTAWNLAVRKSRRERALLRRHLASQKSRTSAAVLAGWRSITTRVAWRRLKLLTALGRSSTRRLSGTLQVWYTYTTHRRIVAGRAALTAARLRCMRLRACLHVWRQWAARIRDATTNLRALCKRLLASTLLSTFREWHLLSAIAAASRTAVARALPSHTRELLTRILAVWWIRHCNMDVNGLGLQRKVTSSLEGVFSSGSGTTTAGLPASYAAIAASAVATPTTGYPDSASAAMRRTSSHVHDSSIHTTRSAPMWSSATLSAALAPGAPLPGQLVERSPEADITCAAPGPDAPDGSAFAVSQLPFHPSLLPVSTLTASPRALLSPVSAPPTATRQSVHFLSSSAPGGPVPPSSAIPPQPRPQSVSSSGSGAAALAAAAMAAAAVASSNSPAEFTFTTSGGAAMPNRHGRTYREALVAGAAATAAAVVAAGVSSHSAAAERSVGDGTGSLPSSTGGRRSSGLIGGSVGPILPTSAAVVGAGSSPVLVQIELGHSSDGPLTPVGLPELLEGPIHSSAISLSATGINTVSPTADEHEDGEEVRSGTDGGVPARRPAEVGPQSHPLYSSTLQEEPSSLLHAPSAIFFPTVARSLRLAEDGRQQRWPGLQMDLPSATLPISGSVPSVSQPQAAAILTMSRRTSAAVLCSDLRRWFAKEVLMCWRRALVARSCWVECLEGVAAAHRRQLVVEVLRAWMQQVLSSRAMSAAVELLARQAKARISRQTRREILTLWHAAARRQATQATLLARHQARCGSRTARRVLVQWRNTAAGLASAERKVKRKTICREKVLLSGVLRCWREKTIAGKSRKDVACKLAVSHKRGLLASALQGWSGAAGARRERATHDARAARYAQRRRLVGVFRVWRWAATETREREARVTRMSSQLALRTAFGSWLRMAAGVDQVNAIDPFTAQRRADSWRIRRVLRGCLRSLAHHKDQQLHKLNCAAEMCTRSTLLAVMRAWRLQTAWKQWRSHALHKMLIRKALRLKSHCFSSWLQLTQKSAATGKVAHQRAELRTVRLAGQLLIEWKAAAAESAATRRQLSSCTTRINHGCMSRTLRAWRMVASQRRARYMRQLLAGKRIWEQRMSRVLQEWAAIAAKLRVSRGIADRRITSYNTALVSTAFAGWVDLTQRLHAVQRTITARRLASDMDLIRHSLYCWVTAVEFAKRAAEAADVKAKQCAASFLLAVLRAWSDLACDNEAQRMRMAGLRNLVLRRRSANAKHYFGAWRDVVLRRQFRDDELKRCLKRKKLAFNLFKQWYWQAFDVDVQDTMLRMFYSTDPAAHSPEPSSRVLPAFRAPPPLLQQALPTYLQQQQQLTSRRPAVLPYGGSVFSRPLDPLPLMNMEEDLNAADYSGGGTMGGASHDSRRRHLAASLEHTGIQQQIHLNSLDCSNRQPATNNHSSLQSRISSIPHVGPSPGHYNPEPVRTLASTFDAVAATASVRGRSASAIESTSIAAFSTRSTAAVASRRRDPAPRTGGYPVLRPSDSSGSSDPGDIPNFAVRGKQTAIVAGTAPRQWGEHSAASSTRTVRPALPEGSKFGSSFPARSSSAGSAQQSRATRPSTVSRTSVTVATTASANARQASVVADIAARRRAASRSAAGSSMLQASQTSMRSTTSSAATVVTAGADGAAVSSLDSVMRVIDFPGGMVHSGNARAGGLTACIRPAQATLSSAGSGVGGVSNAPRLSADKTLDTAVAGAMPLSPLSPPPRGPLHSSYSNTPGSGSMGELPGIMPTWRQVANNQLYSCDEDWYGDYSSDLGPVDPIYMAIAGGGPGLMLSPGAAFAVPVALPVEGSRRQTDEGGGEQLETEGDTGTASREVDRAGLIVAADACGLVGSEGDGLCVSGPQGVTSDGGSVAAGTIYFPRHSIFRNAVFQPYTSDEERKLSRVPGILEEGEATGVEAKYEDMGGACNGAGPELDVMGEAAHEAVGEGSDGSVWVQQASDNLDSVESEVGPEARVRASEQEWAHDGEGELLADSGAEVQPSTEVPRGAEAETVTESETNYARET